MIRKHIYFSGRVQGVGFRYQAAYYARNLGLTGWVRNLSDGRVEMEVQGRETLIGQLILTLKNQPYIRIERYRIPGNSCRIRGNQVQYPLQLLKL